MIIAATCDATTAAEATIVVFVVRDETRSACPAGCHCISCLRGPCVHRRALERLAAETRAIAAQVTRFRRDAHATRRYFEGALPADRPKHRRPARAQHRRKPLARPRSSLPRPMRRRPDIALHRA